MPDPGTSTGLVDVPAVVPANRVLVVTAEPRAADALLQGGARDVVVCEPAAVGTVMDDRWDLVVVDARGPSGRSVAEAVLAEVADGTAAVFVAVDDRPPTRETLQKAGIVVRRTASLGGVPGLLLGPPGSRHEEVTSEELLAQLFAATARQSAELAAGAARLEELRRRHDAALRRWNETSGLRWEVSVVRGRGGRELRRVARAVRRRARHLLTGVGHGAG